MEELAVWVCLVVEGILGGWLRLESVQKLLSKLCRKLWRSG